MGSGLADIASSAAVNIDYARHSEMLHVNPREAPLPILRKGHAADNNILSLGSTAEESCRGPLPKFALAHSRTQDVLRRFLEALAEAEEGIT